MAMTPGGEATPAHHPHPAKPTRRAHAPRRAVAWAWDVIHDHGAERADGTVALGYTQAELSALSGWGRNDGRVYTYLRDLGDVVIRKRGEVILHRRRLIELEQTLVVRPLSARTVEVGQQLLETFGRPAADGTMTLQVDRGDGSSRPAQLADMADTLGINRSSTHRHVQALRDNGHIADARRSRPTLRSVPDDHDPDVTTDRAAVLEALLAVDERIIDAHQQLLADMTERDRLYSLLDPSESAAASAPVPRLPGALRAEKGADSAGQGADTSSKEEMRGVEMDLKCDSQPPLLSSQGAEPADGAPKRARTRGADRGAEGAEPRPAVSLGDSPDRDWQAADLAELVAELIDACGAANCQAMTDPAGLVVALAGKTRAQIVYAQRQIAQQVRNGSSLRSPFGVLYKASLENNPGYFPPPRARPEPKAVVVADAPTWTEPPAAAEAAVAALEESGDTAALDDLDRHWVAALGTSVAGTQKWAERVRGSPNRLHAERVGVWARLNSADSHPPAKESP
ncbi:MAG: hypothetical protein M3083_18170 [Actinomycetota bacterium]|nr:hypothetical protein [Actinomycetota bacterium]